MQFLVHVWRSRPAIGNILGWMLGWGTVTPLCILADYLLWRHMLPPNSLRLNVIFALGAALAAPLAIWCIRILSSKNANTAFAASFVLLGIGTIGLTALIFALDFWQYFVQWHGQAFSKLWLNQFIYTCASALYQFLVSGLRLYLPFGFLALVAASLWASKRIMR